MTHPKEAIEAVALALATVSDMGDTHRNVTHMMVTAIAILDRISPLLVAAEREACAMLCEAEADACEDAAKWGGSKRYVQDCKAAAFAHRNRAAAIRGQGGN